MTPGQERQLTRVILDILRKSGRQNQPAVNRILARGGQLKAILLPAFTSLGAEVALVDSDLLEPVTVILSPAAKAFRAKKKFAIGTQNGVVIGRHGGNFEECFLNDAGESKTDVLVMNLRIHMLRKRSFDGPIIKELGGGEIIETNLAVMWELMKKQGSGQAGDLLVNRYPNLFYIRDDVGALFAVTCYWYSVNQEWHVYAYPAPYEFDWGAGTQIFSR